MESSRALLEQVIAWRKRADGSNLPARLGRMIQSLPFRLLGPFSLFTAAAWVVVHDLRPIEPVAILNAVAGTPPAAIFAASVLTAASYVCLAVTEGFALRWLGHGLSWPRAATVAATAYAVSNTVGFSLASGGLVRMRMYCADGLRAVQAAGVTILTGAAVSLSGVVMAGLGLALLAIRLLPASPGWTAIAAALALMAPASLWFVAFRSRRGPPFMFQPRLLALLAGLGDWLFSSAALYCLLPQVAVSAFPLFLGVYVLGSLVSAASGVPGGLGVFEAIVISLTSLMPVQLHETAAALLLYRLIYGFAPLGLAALAALCRGAIGRLGRKHAHDR